MTVLRLTFEKRLHGRKVAMRQSIRSTVSTGTTSSSASRRRSVRVVLLNLEEIIIPVEPKAKLQDVFNRVCDQIGLRETEYFGITQLVDNEHRFLDLDLKVQKLNPKAWKALSKQNEGEPLATLYFRVQFYIDHVMLLRERITRHMYYLQLRNNLLTYDQIYGDERFFLLAAYALQADHGNLKPEQHEKPYFEPREYFPAWMLSRYGDQYIRKSMPRMHADFHGMTRVEAQMHYIRDASLPPAGHNLLFYRLKKRKTDDLGTAWLGICPKGIEIYEEVNGFKSILSTFLWPNIGKLCFEKKKFEIRAEGSPEGRKFVYYTGGDERSKYLLSQCRITHLFQINVQPKLAEMKHLEAEDKRRYKESYIYSDNKEKEHELSSTHRNLSRSISSGLRSLPTPPSTGALDQRYSVISNTSSNTTSGIISDRLHVSFDGSEDDPGVEIMIDSPPNKLLSSFKSRFQSTPAHSPPGLGAIGFSPVNRLSGGSAGVSAAATATTTATATAGHWPLPPSRVAGRSVTPQRASLSRSSSNHSSRSSRHSQQTELAAAKHVLPPKPAPAQIQRVTLAPTMTVSSTPLPPGVGVLGRATSIHAASTSQEVPAPTHTVASNVSVLSHPLPLSMAYPNIEENPYQNLQTLTQVVNDNPYSKLQTVAPLCQVSNVSEYPVITQPMQQVMYVPAADNYQVAQSSVPTTISLTMSGTSPHSTHLIHSVPLHIAHMPQQCTAVTPHPLINGQCQTCHATAIVHPDYHQMAPVPHADFHQGVQVHPEFHQAAAVHPDYLQNQVLHPEFHQAGAVHAEFHQVSAPTSVAHSVATNILSNIQPPPYSSHKSPALYETAIVSQVELDHQAEPYAVMVNSSAVGATAPLTVLPSLNIAAAAGAAAPAPQTPPSYLPASPLTPTKDMTGMSPQLSIPRFAYTTTEAAELPTPLPQISPSHLLPSEIDRLHTHHSFGLYTNTCVPSSQQTLNLKEEVERIRAFSASQAQTQVSSRPPSDDRTRSASSVHPPASASALVVAQAYEPGMEKIRAMSGMSTPPHMSPTGGAAIERFKSLSALNESPPTQIRHNSWGQADHRGGRRRRSRRSRTCPVHDVRSDVAKEIRDLKKQNLSLPMITALFNDVSLKDMCEHCNCDGTKGHHDGSKHHTTENHQNQANGERRLSDSFSSPSPTSTIGNVPGTVVRPFSWHSEAFSGELQALDSLQLDEPPYQNLPAVLNSLHGNKSVNAWRDTNGNITTMASSNTYSQQFPARLSSGGHSPNSSDTLCQHPNIGMA